MSLAAKYLFNGKHLRANVSGHFSLTSALSCFEDILKTAYSKEFLKIYIDATKVTGNLSTLDRFHLGNIFVESYLKYERKYKIHVQILILGIEPVIDTKRFAETVATNRGASIKITTDINEASKWLEK